MIVFKNPFFRIFEQTIGFISARPYLADLTENSPTRRLSISDHKPAPTVDHNDRNIFDSSTELELLNKSMDKVARQIGGMDLGDPTRSDLTEELCGLGQLKASLKSERDKLINPRMDRLAREVGTLKRDDSRLRKL